MKSQKVATTITIAMHKGGVAKSVTAMALASGLAQAGFRTLLIDLDAQAHSTKGLSVEVGRDDPTVAEFFDQQPPTPLLAIARETYIKGLFVVPSHIKLTTASEGLYRRMHREKLLKKGLEPVLPEFSFVIVDCSPSLGPLVATAVWAADLVLVPCQMEAQAADSLQDLLDFMSVVKEGQFEDWRILLTRIDARTTVTNEAVMDSLAPWHHKILDVRIPQSQPLNQAQMVGQSIFDFSPGSKGAQAYAALTAEILRRYEPGHEAESMNQGMNSAQTT